MNISLTTPMAYAVGFALLAGAAGHALAQDQDSSAPKTRAQVQAELLEAQRTGNIIALGHNSGKMLNELYPDRYPAANRAR